MYIYAFVGFYIAIGIIPIPINQFSDLNLFTERPLPPTLLVEPQKYIFIADEPVVIRCRLPRDQSATEIYLYQNESVIKESDNFGVLSLANIKKTNTGRYTCLYKTDVSQRTIDSSISNQEALIVIGTVNILKLFQYYFLKHSAA